MNGKPRSKSNKNLDDLQIRSKSRKNITDIIESSGKAKESEMYLQRQLSQLQKSNDLLVMAEQKYRSTYDNTPVLLRTVTIDGIISDCNEAYAKALGYTKNEIVGKSIYEHTAERSIDAMKNNFKNWANDKEVTQCEIWLKRKDGSVFLVLLKGASLFDEQGKLIGRTVALTDLTEMQVVRKRHEENQKELHAQVKQL